MTGIPAFRAADQHKDLENPAYRAFKAFLADAEDWSADRIATYQLDTLDALVRMAVTEAPGYEKLYADHGVAMQRIRDFSDMDKLPFVDKSLLRAEINAFSVSTREKDYVTTGGSTGIPFGFFRSSDAFAKELAAKAHQYHRVGWREGQKQVVFRGTPIDTPDHSEFYPEFNELRLSSYHLTDAKLDRFLELIDSYEPEWLRCYPSSAELLARYLIKKGRRLEGLKGMLCASENLYEHQIKLFSQAFSGKVFSHYGHYEQAVLAGFCETEQTYHVLPFYGYAELLNGAGGHVRETGAVGEIVGTSFIMDATLFIRYRTQDFAVYGQDSCASCNRPYPTWDRIEGRLQDWVIAADGRPVSMTAFNMHDATFDHVSQFQLVQHQPGKVTFAYMPKADLSGTQLDAMLAAVGNRLGPGFDIKGEAVTDIPLSKRGKHRFLKQTLPLTFGDQGVTELFAESLAP